jgi:hypothetical protein
VNLLERTHLPAAEHIALVQAANSKVEFRRIEIKEFDGADAPEEVVVGEPFVPLFNGKDLTGWKTNPLSPG